MTTAGTGGIGATGANRLFVIGKESTRVGSFEAVCPGAFMHYKQKKTD